MKKLLIPWVIILNFALMSGTAFAQAQYLINGQNPLTLTIDVGTCTTVTIEIVPGDVITTPLISAGFWLVFDLLHGYVRDVAPYDGTILPALWDQGFTILVPNPGSGTYFLSVHNAAGVSLNDLRIADVEFCCEGPGQSQITISTIPEFDTVIGDDQTVWDSQITSGIIDLFQVAPPCTCDISGPAFVQADMIMPVTAQYTVNPGDVCENQPDYVWSDDCVIADVDQTGLLHVPATTEMECCTITVMDTANTDINTGEPVWCGFPICLEGG